jgi:DNA-binding ferritin-like protein
MSTNINKSNIKVKSDTKVKLNTKVKSNTINNSKERSLQKIQQKIIIKFLEILNVVKIYHWKTRSYATHKATDELYERLNENIDKFVEVLLGKNEGRVNLMNIESIPIEDFDDIKFFKKKINSYITFLIGLSKKKSFDEKIDSDLFSIRDDILADFNQFLYLLTFK